MSSDMSLPPTLEEQELHADTFRRSGSRMTTRELAAEALVASGFVLAAFGIWLLRPPHAFAIAPAAVCLLVLVLATRVRFDTPFGYTVPTQLAFVPLVFVLPAALVPIAVVLALAIARLPELARGRAPASRLVHVAGNSWFAIGPAAVFAISNIEPASRRRDPLAGRPWGAVPRGLRRLELGLPAGPAGELLRPGPGNLGVRD